MAKLFRILAISDIHAETYKNSSAESLINERNWFKDQIVSDLIEHFKHNQRKIDLLVCPGDIANRGNAYNLRYGLRQLERIGKELSIGSYIVTPGNHDVSRDGNPKNRLNTFPALFSNRVPTKDSSINDFFWKKKWCHFELNDVNILAIDSSSYHIDEDGNENCNELMHGRIDNRVIDEIGDYIKSPMFKKKAINIAVCHHHPTEIPTPITKDFEHMFQGPLLIDRITNPYCGPWVIIHGHQHWPNLQYGMCQHTMKPVIMSCGSFSAYLEDLNEKYGLSNQVHLLELSLDITRRSGIAHGKCFTFEWNVGRGWIESSSVLMTKIGFGSPSTPIEVAVRLNQYIEDNGYSIGRDEIGIIAPELMFYTPGDIKALKDNLRTHNCEIEEIDNEIVSIGRAIIYD